ncbi:MAG TPA: 4-hydroxy-tetrahydrodipicolinate synthase [Candidatus Mcinerneyibacteriales bacterium]|nr:4-hydroxy-tetrahydrodipicolinate synthase [Candidatus Mcinerneyibacteriales bacterium]HPE20451.1 4-hydroxy-tetrahydrodipicolinate synthase [Candidatus Mcinerneyibacteriales bacterium]HPJ70029.1 4-hydroxy-tetrahydrodipicolinate synthase [Candidatus Mcinerneyibacteriales bacterium]HPQ88550.1 4-hydroxy-tetrahydrodipicolinate synthase [Candidatus Mcinerneyibacteriales bacterium]
MREFRGAYTALITPFAGDAVDYEGLRKNVRYQIENRIDGLVVLGTTAETPTLTESEKEKIIETVCKEAAGRIPIIVGTGSNSTQATIQQTRQAKQAGADAALIVTPYYNKPGQEGIFRHFEAITQAIDYPVIVYNIPGRTGVNIETATLERIAALPSIVGVKEASGNINQVSDVIHRIRNHHDHFSVLSGDDSMALPLVALGGDGVISVISNLVPGLVGSMIRNAINGNYEKARQENRRLFPLARAAFVETNPVPIKKAMELCGLPAGPVRLPLWPLSVSHEEDLKNVLSEAGLIPREGDVL